MARTAITPTTIAESDLNLTDATFATLTTGAGNGVKFPYKETDLWVLKNGTGGSATFTIKVAQPATFSAQSITVPDKTLAVATGKTHIFPARPAYIQPDGMVYIECSVAGNVLPLTRYIG